MAKAECKKRTKQVPLVMSSEEFDIFSQAKDRLQSEKGWSISNREFVMVLCMRYLKNGLGADKDETKHILDLNTDSLMQIRAILDKQIESNRIAEDDMIKDMIEGQ